jgi:hypothetical protein
MLPGKQLKVNTFTPWKTLPWQRLYFTGTTINRRKAVNTMERIFLYAIIILTRIFSDMPLFWMFYELYQANVPMWISRLIPWKYHKRHAFSLREKLPNEG